MGHHSHIGLVFVQKAVFHHHPGAGAVGALFVGLEHQDYLALQFLFVLFQQGGGGEQHGGVAVVAAGVHDPITFRGKGQTGLLAHGQGVHVGPEQDLFPFFFADDAHNGAGADLLPGDAHVIQGFFHQGRGLGQTAAQLRMVMDLPAPGQQLFVHLFGFFVHHVDSLSFLSYFK